MSRKTGGIVVIQYNWEENIRENEVEGETWVYYKQLQEKSKHGYIGDGTFNVVSQNNRIILVNNILNNLPTLFVCPARKCTNIHSKSIISLDVAEGGLGASVCTENKLHVWEAQDGLVRRCLEGHVFDVYRCRLFPSGVVVLSGGADMQIKIFDAVSGTCGVTMKGHTASVTDIAIIGRGRNIISVSKDGTARLWNCAEAKCLSTLVKTETEINCCDVIDTNNQINMPDCNEMADELEFNTEGKLLALGCEDGKVFITSIHGKEIMATHFLTCSILSICWLPSYHLIIGLEDGRVMIMDARNVNEIPQVLSHDSASGVLCLKPMCGGVLLGRKDGVCQFYRLDGFSPVQLTGPDCDPIYSISVDSKFVYTACRDAVIRKYSIQDMGLSEL